MELVYESSGESVQIGDLAQTGKGEVVVIQGIEKPRHSASTGRIYVTPKGVKYDGLNSRSYFPSVIGAEWINREDR